MPELRGACSSLRKTQNDCRRQSDEFGRAELNENENSAETDENSLERRDRSGTILRLQRFAATRAEYSKQSVSKADNTIQGEFSGYLR